MLRQYTGKARYCNANGVEMTVVVLAICYANDTVMLPVRHGNGIGCGYGGGYGCGCAYRYGKGYGYAMLRLWIG